MFKTGLVSNMLIGFVLNRLINVTHRHLVGSGSDYTRQLVEVLIFRLFFLFLKSCYCIIAYHYSALKTFIQKWHHCFLNGWKTCIIFSCFNIRSTKKARDPLWYLFESAQYDKTYFFFRRFISEISGMLFRKFFKKCLL